LAEWSILNNRTLVAAPPFAASWRGFVTIFASITLTAEFNRRVVAFREAGAQAQADAQAGAQEQVQTAPLNP